MSVYAGPETSSNGLVACWDAGNNLRSARGFSSLLSLSNWTLGTGTATGWSMNGTAAENQRILATGPFGTSTLVWDTPSNDATSDGDGGYNSPVINIDPTKMYRFSTWIRRTVIGNGNYYLGFSGYDAATQLQSVILRVNGANTTNPYFSASTWPTANVSANSWMLVVGHVWPAGTGVGANHVDSGLWNTSGTKFSNPTSSGDFVWLSDSAKTWLRSYLFYSTDTTTAQQWYQPRIDVIDGNQPSISDLISGVGSKWYDAVGNSHGTILNSAAPYNSNGYMTFDGVDDCVTLSVSGNAKTVISWVRPTAVSGDYIIFAPDSNGNDNWLGIQTNKLYLFFSEAGDVNNTVLRGNTSLSTNQWYQISCTIDTNTAKVYLNGVEDGSMSVAFTIGAWTGTSAIGRRGSISQRFFPGDIGAIYLYNRVLSEGEIKQNFIAMRGRFGI